MSDHAPLYKTASEQCCTSGRDQTECLCSMEEILKGCLEDEKNGLKG